MRFIRIKSQFINLKYVSQIVERKDTFWVYFFSNHSKHILGSSSVYEEKFEITDRNDYEKVKRWLDKNTI